MAAKALLLCASALFVQSALSQCLGRIGNDWGYDGLGYGSAWNGHLGCGCGGITPAAELAASYGGGLGVASSSCAAPTGLAITSENSFEGCLGVVGNLPFLGTAGVEGVYPTAGSGAINYGCGDGAVGITAEGGYGTGLGYGAELGNGAGISNRGYGLGGCGCGCL